MRILLTADPGLPVPPTLYGGIERIIGALAVALQDRGHVVALLADRDSTCPVNHLFPWPQTSVCLATAHEFARRLRAATHEFRPDILHSFSRLLFLVPVLPTRLAKIMSFQREPSPRTVRGAAWLGGRSLRFTGCSDYITARGRRAGGNWSTVYNFVDTGKYTFQPTVPANAPMVFLSRVERIKGAHTAIEICRRAGRRLIIAGNHADDDSPSGRYWRSEILPHLRKDYIDYVGCVDDEQKNELLGRAAALIVPIEWEEPFGIVFAEALACGTPVISCFRGALPEIVRHGVDGFLVASSDDAVAAIRKLGNLSRAACRSRAEENFSLEAVVPQYEKLYAKSMV